MFNEFKWEVIVCFGDILMEVLISLLKLSVHNIGDKAWKSFNFISYNFFENLCESKS